MKTPVLLLNGCTTYLNTNFINTHQQYDERLNRYYFICDQGHRYDYFGSYDGYMQVN